MANTQRSGAVNRTSQVVGIFALVHLLACGNEPAEKPAVEEEVRQAQAPSEAIPSAPPDALPVSADERPEHIHGETVRYQAGETRLVGYLAYDKNIEGPRPGVLVVHEWWGHNAYSRRRAELLAQMGYTALALDMYGDGKQAEHPDDAAKFSQAVNQDLEGAVARFEAARAVLEEHATTDANRTAAIGYCFGGGIVLHMARIGADLDLVASFHGMLAPQGDTVPSEVKAKLLVFHGAADPFVSAEVAEAFQTEMAAAGAQLDFVAYPDVKHGFTNPGATALGERFELPLEYNGEADAASWAALEAGLQAAFSVQE